MIDVKIESDGLGTRKHYVKFHILRHILYIKSVCCDMRFLIS